jgi:two-component system sensor histidine kinase HydH
MNMRMVERTGLPVELPSAPRTSAGGMAVARGPDDGVVGSPVADGQIMFTERERELGAIIASYNDVTERLKSAHERLGQEVARLREELRQKNAELRRRERLAALGEMAAGLAHEVRNPLGGIALYASMLEGQLADRPASRTAASKISQGVRALDRLVGEILDFAQEHRLDPRPCRLADVLSAVQESIRPWAAEQMVDVAIDPAALEVEACCDSLRMQQVLLNLVMNGIQAVGENGHVWVSASRRTDGHGIEIEVYDDGPGIPPENLDRIFNPFFTTRATGTGLGLAIVHRIVEAHGGVIRASNRSEGGARFVIRLPSKPGEGGDGEMEEEGSTASAG